MADLERELDRLYGLPPAEFTRARNELAKQLRSDGEREAAEQVRALSKPTTAAWAINQLARRRQAGVSELLDAAAALRSAQARALSGGGGDAVRRAAAHRGEMVRKLATEARTLLEEAGLKATDSTIERVATTLAAASIDDDGRRLLSRGRLSSEQSPTGFEAVGDLPPPSARRREPRTDRAREQAEATERKRRLRELEAEHRRLDREARTAERDAERAEREAEKAAERATTARATADEAAERAEAASRELEQARRGA